LLRPKLLSSAKSYC